MADDVQQWMAKRPGRGGVFDDYSVQGIQYESTNGEVAWHIRAWGDRNPVSNYWVAQQKFYGISIHFGSNAKGEDRIEIFGEKRNIPDAEKNAIFKAITEWER